MIKQIKKRSGSVVPFDAKKITEAIWKAAEAVDGKDRERAEFLAAEVVHHLEGKFQEDLPSVEDVQDEVEKVLIEFGHAKTAKAFILYRQKRKEMREARERLGINEETKISLNALKILEERYLCKDENGKVIETPSQLFRRVAHNISLADQRYGQDAKKSEEEFFGLMTSFDFLPNSPTLMNAGTAIQQLSACFVLPIEDDIPQIFDSVKNTAIIHKTGGGTGFSFSRLRPKGDLVGTTGGIASGPISFMKVFDCATEQIKQGGKRRGANMGILRVDHPDVLEFIGAKEKNTEINNFNLSVAITDAFMEVVEKNEDYDLINPRGKRVVGRLNAKHVFNLISMMAWKNGEPGVVFIDRMNQFNPTPKLGPIESTNPCGEQPLLPYESCNLGSLNLVNFVDAHKKIDWNRLKVCVHKCTHFLDNVIDMNRYPLPEIKKLTEGNRKIGLGVMGWADALIKMELAYNDPEAVKLADEVMCFINLEAMKASAELAKKRGTFPNFKDSIYDTGKIEDKMRNATRTTIAPTGTISILSSCSSGIEPLFAISYLRKTPQFELLEVNPLFEEVAKEEGFYSEELMRKIAGLGSIKHVEEIPEKWKRIFVTAMDLTPEDHVRMQAAFQKHVNNAVSKTVNFPNSATVEEVAEVYRLAYKLGCKGTTIYRDGSRDVQVLNVVKEQFKEEPKAEKKVEKKPVTVAADYAGGCTSCHV